MKVGGFIGLASLLGHSVVAHPSAHSADHHHLQTRQNGGVVITTGAPGNVSPRYEIRQLQAQHSQQWSLFILAMQKWQAMDSNNLTSYYQLATIHGQPYQSWNGVGADAGCQDCGGGYCPHDIALFPGWHRAYLALYEQQFVAIAQQIAATYPSNIRQSYIDAAASIRFPYFDWAAIPPSGQDAIPTSITSPQITVTGPGGQTTISNPLYSFKLLTEIGIQYPWSSYNPTLRYPNNEPTNNAQSSETYVIQAFNKNQKSLQSQVYNLLTQCNDFQHFSNDNAGNSRSCSNSLEGIHNTVHSISGGYNVYDGNQYGGHMAWINVASFDPLFWLHHMNVDRIFSMWQTIHASYGASQYPQESTWTYSSKTLQTADSPLKPFRKDANTFWTTNTVKNWASTFKYTYPEFVDSKGDAAAIKSYANKLYGPSASATAGSSKRTTAPNPGSPNAATASAPASSGLLTYSNGSTVEYVANLHLPRYQLDGSWSVVLFKGTPVSENPAQWIFDPNYISTVGVPAMAGMKKNKALVSSSISFTKTLTDAFHDGKLANMHVNNVAPYLRDNLHWRIHGPNGNVDPASLKGFQIGVFSTSSFLQATDQLPQWSQYLPLIEATQGKPGGADLLSTIFNLEKLFSL
ncbi:Hypothetical protein R9X50_00601900 [Acrodontium crateriforme]|uniref:tyrosinase n=1 Tax=Acrodontium crateriforme TaxID=150365 RepID=A0AAQ3M852_9PEZI|nr:Hypothetical protein R9X50_00601900 [Acrodontium crateriforme]